MLYFPRWKIALILLVGLISLIVTIPNLFSAQTVESWPSFLPQRQMILGLDLRGGAHLLLEVDRDSLVEDRVETLIGDVRQNLREARIGYQNLAARDQVVSFTLRDAADATRAVEALRPLTDPIQSGLFGQGSVSEVELGQNGAQITLALTDNGIE